MTATPGLQLQWLTDQTINTYRPLLPTGLDQQLQLQGKPRLWHAAGRHALAVNLFGVPLGVLLLQTRGPIWSRSAEVVSLMVAERFRRRGLATRLLDNTRATLAKAGCRALRLAYPKTAALEPAMLNLCSNARGWQPSDCTVLYSCTVAEVPAFVASLKPYVDRFTALAPLHCIAYRDLKVQQVRQAVRQWKPPYWAVPPIPGQRSDGWGTFDDLMSQGLLLNDALVGWCLCHRISETAHRMTVAYVGETFQRKGWMMLPVLKAVQTLEDWNAQQGLNPDHGIRFGIQTKNKAMIHFAERRIKPFALKTTLTVERVTKLP